MLLTVSCIFLMYSCVFMHLSQAFTCFLNTHLIKCVVLVLQSVTLTIVCLSLSIADTMFEIQLCPWILFMINVQSMSTNRNSLCSPWIDLLLNFSMDLVPDIRLSWGCCWKCDKWSPSPWCVAYLALGSSHCCTFMVAFEAGMATLAVIPIINKSTQFSYLRIQTS